MPNLVEVIKKVAIEAVQASNPISLVIGEVTSVNPLNITVEQRLTLDEDFLILTKNVTDHYVDMSVSHSTVSQGIAGLSHSHKYSGYTQETNIDEHQHTVQGSESLLETSTVVNGATIHKHAYEGTTDGSLSAEATLHGHGYKGRKKVLIHYELKQGESVLLIKIQGGQKYIVLDRIGVVPTEGEWV